MLFYYMLGILTGLPNNLSLDQIKKCCVLFFRIYLTKISHTVDNLLTLNIS